ncbi:MAG TPA: hypothetical protein VEW68_00410, partial [Patescibacteria group bacterium]|nr:hypothetical protein [Patescibacteria group bacterium]
MNIITDHWRLKLLAIGLAILMLGAVAFSENPPRTKTLIVPLHYETASNLVLINPPTKTPVTITGLADVIAPVTADNLVAIVDATNIDPTKTNPGQPVKVNVKVTPLVPGAFNAQEPAPIAVTVDVLQTVALPVAVVASPARGWALDTVEARCPGGSPCMVTFRGPSSWATNLRASVTYPTPVNVGTIDAPGQTVQLTNNTGNLDLSTRTVPVTAVDPP